MTLLRLGFSALLLMTLVACATVSNETSFKKIRPGQRVYIGKFNVNFSGDTKPNCEIYINYDLAPSIKLSSDGYLFYKTDRENLTFKSMACLHKATNRLSAWHHQKLNLKPILRAKASDEVSYFGDVNLTWKIDGADTVAAAQKDYTSPAQSKEGRVDNSGEIKISVVDAEADTKQQFLTKNPEIIESEFKFKTQLVGIE